MPKWIVIAVVALSLTFHAQTPCKFSVVDVVEPDEFSILNLPGLGQFDTADAPLTPMMFVATADGTITAKPTKSLPPVLPAALEPLPGQICAYGHCATVPVSVRPIPSPFDTPLLRRLDAMVLEGEFQILRNELRALSLQLSKPDQVSPLMLYTAPLSPSFFFLLR